MEPGLHYGIYDALLDTNLKATLDRYPELRAVLGKIEAEEQPARYADFVAKLVEQVLREESSPEKRLAKDFSPSTMYADYPISRELLHWESQSHTKQESPTGQNLIHHEQHGYTILIFARDQKKTNNCTVPFTYLGPAERMSFESERPIEHSTALKAVESLNG